MPTSTLVPWAKNPRRNDGRPVDAVAESIRRFGFGAPIIARRADMRVIAGHTRLKAAVALGLDRVPVRFLDVTDAQADQLALADNKTGEIAEWDDAKVQDILHTLLADGQELYGLGWSNTEMDEMLAQGDADLASAFDALPGGEQGAFRTMTFTVTAAQRDSIDQAIERAKALCPFVDTGNENSNGNALARIAEAFRP